MLKAGVKEEDVEVEREWVLPTHLREKWSLRRFAAVFDAVGDVPEALEESALDAEVEQENGEKGQESGDGVAKKRRGEKRVLLAAVNDDSTIVYYIVHDGIVKPRQN